MFFRFLPYICDDVVYFRLKSIDMKYQVWKLGVVFTDNVSSDLSNMLWLLLGCVPHCSYKAKIKVSLPANYFNR